MLGMVMAAALLAAQQVPIPSLSWLSGTWRTIGPSPRSGPAFTEEIWTDARHGTLIGISRTVQGGRVQSFEFLRIAADGPDLVLFASPGGGAPVRFAVARIGPQEIVFENPKHDFPQRISYRRDGVQLTARISLMNGDRAQRWVYRLRRPD